MTLAATHTHDRTLANAIGAALDRVEHHLTASDFLMADVSGAIVRKLLSHPCAGMYSADLVWRRMLMRWEKLRTRLGPPPIMLADLVDHHAGTLLVEATREAQRSAH